MNLSKANRALALLVGLFLFGACGKKEEKQGAIVVKNEMVGSYSTACISENKWVTINGVAGQYNAYQIKLTISENEMVQIKSHYVQSDCKVANSSDYQPGVEFNKKYSYQITKAGEAGKSDYSIRYTALDGKAINSEDTVGLQPNAYVTGRVTTILSLKSEKDLPFYKE